MRTTMLIVAALAAVPASAQTTRQMTGEVARGYARADAALNAAYRAAMARARAADADPDPGPRPTSPTHAGALLAAQRAWLAFRDAECVRQGYEYFGGTMQSMQVIGCKRTLTEERTGQLRERPEGE